MEEVLKLLKLDLGIHHDKRDDYFRILLEAVKQELISKGIVLDLTKAEDQLLLSDYAAWHYRKRQEDIPISKNLNWRLMNRKVKARAREVKEWKANYL